MGNRKPCVPFPPSAAAVLRRLVRPLLLSLLSSKLRPGGLLHVATDVEVYAEHTARVVKEQNSRFRSPKQRAFTEEEETQSALSGSTPPQPPTAAAAAGKGEERPGNLDERKNRRVERIPRAQPVGDACGSRSQKARDEGQGGSSRASREEVSVRWEGGETTQRPSSRPLTKYEERAREAGRHVWDFRYRYRYRLE